MTNILEIAKAILGSLPTKELAETTTDTEMVEAPSLEEQTVIYLTACLTRANHILDKRKVEVFAQVLNLPNVAAIERAIVVYDKPYLLGLSLSLEATVELVDELILVARRRGIKPSKAWQEVSQMNIELGPEVTPVIGRRRPLI